MKPWNVVVDGAKYEIKPKGTKVVVNGEKKKLDRKSTRLNSSHL